MTTNKLYRAILLLCATVAVMSFLSCATDEEDDTILEEVVIQPEPKKPSPPPGPDWADNIITIRTGRYQTGLQLLQALDNKWNFAARRRMRWDLADPDFPMSKSPGGVVDVTIVTLLEAGFKKPVTIHQIRERYRELGYRPLTLEEAVELRLQFTDQPDSSEKKPTEQERHWSYFFVLISEEDAEFLLGDILLLYRSSYRREFGEEFGIAPTSAGRRKFNPFSVLEPSHFSLIRDMNELPISFACVKVK
ncbi:MAG: hypothetical protein OXI43_03930 [Candidatus Poribacteria bacterium]|nr:hypothetical protein [Candidatus Poribacteria bacterium]